jgi:hypothetical protein
MDSWKRNKWECMGSDNVFELKKWLSLRNLGQQSALEQDTADL